MFREEGCGYHETMFTSASPYYCTLCFMVARHPRICRGCSCMYCEKALPLIAGECITCSGKVFTQLDGEMRAAYIRQMMFCPMCSKEMTLMQYEQHGCVNPKVACQNVAICKNPDIARSQFIKQGVCGPACLLTQMKVKECSQKDLLQTIQKLVRDPRVIYAPPK